MEKTLYQQRQEFLDDMIAYYSPNPKATRATWGIECLYLTDDGRKCAIGRFINKEIEGLPKFIGDVGTLLKQWPDCLPEEVLNLGTGFLEEVQLLHDRAYYWDEVGLSPSGIERVLSITERFINVEE